METLKEIEKKSNLCRVCLGLGEYDIYSGVIAINDKNIQIDEILKEFTSLDLENLDLDSSKIPNLICSLCSNKLIQSYQFLQEIRQADDYIMNLLTSHIMKEDEYNLNYKTEKLESDIEQEEEEEGDYTVHIVDEYGQELIEQVHDPLTIVNNTEFPKEIKNERKRKTNNKKKPNLILTEKVSNILSHIQQNVSKNGDTDDNDIIDENITTNKKLKISNIDNSIEDVAFIITKFIPCYENNQIDNSNQTDESTINQYNNDDIIKTQNIVRTYDLAAVEIDPTDKNQFEKLLVRNYDENDDDENSDSSDGAVYACQYCPRAFSSSQFLKQHVRKSHVCQFCMKGFEKSAQLFEHIRNNHSQFNCPFCQKSYKSNSNLRQHMKKIHTFKLPAHTSLLAFNKKDQNLCISNENDGTAIG